jgi:AcrR family transcriptional regulator
MTLVKKRLPGRPRDEALQERRCRAILKVAASMFARHGFTATDVQWIADRLKISKGTVYRYFPSKEKLFLAAVQGGILRMHQHIESARRGADDKIEEIRAAVSAYLQFFKTNPELVELFVQERAEFKERRRPIYFQHRDVRRGPWREHFADLIAEGRIRPMPVERAMDVLGDVLYGAILTNHFSGRQKAFEAQAQDVLDVFFNGILTEKGRNGSFGREKSPGAKSQGKNDENG